MEQTALGLYIEENFDIDGLMEMGFFQTKDLDQLTYIKSKQDYARMEARINTFFGLKRITDYSKLPPFGNGVETEAEKQVTEIVSPKDWLLDGQRLVNLIENN